MTIMNKLENISDTVRETYYLYQNGKSIQEIAKLRDLKETTIYSHFEVLISNKLVELDDIINSIKKEKILAVLKENNFTNLKEIKYQLDESISYGEIKCVLAFKRLQNIFEYNKIGLASGQEIKETKIYGNVIDEQVKIPESLNTEIFAVEELTNYIKNLLESDKKLTNLWVRGEISNLKKHASGHIYFSLKDKESQIRCVLFRRVGDNINFNLEHGMKIIVSGNLDVYKPSGQYSIIIEELQPDGLGDLNLAFIQLKNKLEKENLFLDEYKKPLPKFPEVICIITSSTGSVIQDILNIIKRRYPLVRILIAPTVVQGKEAASSIVDSIKLINELPYIDVIILGRGGGSLEDLWCFNEEIVARAIFRSKIPIISAVGHETDFTISDFVSDYRAPTPSAAAEKVVPDIIEIYEHIKHLNIRSAKSLYHKLRLYKSNLKQIMSRFIFKRPTEIVHSNYRELDHISSQLQNSIIKIIGNRKKDLEIVESKIIALNPMAILERGYSIVMNKNKILTNSSDVKKGEDINIILYKGKIGARVKKTLKK